jgi:hypothetical protein
VSLFVPISHSSCANAAGAFADVLLFVVLCLQEAFPVGCNC